MSGVRFNSAEKVFRFANGARVEIGQMESEADYRKFQGQSYSLIIVDEAQQHPDPFLLDRLRSNLRSPSVPCRLVLVANAGDKGMWWLSERHGRRGAWEPYTDPTSGRRFVRCGGTYRDNPHAGDDYPAQLRASLPGDPALLAAWLENDWDRVQGGFLSGALSYDRSAFGPWQPGDIEGLPLQLYLAYDHGTARPSVAFMCAEVEEGFDVEGQHFVRGSILLLDEEHTARSDHWDRGLELTVPQIASRILDMCRAWGHVDEDGCADPSIFARHGHAGGSIADQFSECGVRFYKADNDRAGGWSRMRTLLAQAGSGEPGLYVSRACRGFWATVPSLPRSSRNPSDADTGACDHWADSCRYACGYEAGGDDELMAVWL